MPKRKPQTTGFIDALARDFRRLRTANGLTQAEAAELVGYKNPSNISAFESGDARPRQPHFDLIAGLVDAWRKAELAESLRHAAVHAAREDGPKGAFTEGAPATDLLDALARAYDAGRADLAAKLRAAVGDLDALDKKRKAVIEQQAEILREIYSVGEKGAGP